MKTFYYVRPSVQLWPADRYESLEKARDFATRLAKAQKFPCVILQSLEEVGTDQPRGRLMSDPYLEGKPRK